MEIVDFADPYTKKIFAKKAAFCAVLINSYSRMGQIIDQIDKKFQMSRIKMVRFTERDAAALARTLKGQNVSLNGLTADVAIAMELRHQNGMEEWASFATRLSGLAYAGDFCNMFWGGGKNMLACATKTTAKMSGCACCVVKPHAVKAKATGSVISDILAAGWEISALSSFQLDQGSAEEFTEVYKGVIPNYEKHVKELCSGPCVALEVRPGNQKQSGSDVVQEFRKLAGPFEYEFAKELRPSTLRAKYGKSQIQSGVHATDLPDDGPLESEYLFGLLYGQQ
jgi:nucleoside-diphosphate kinase